MCEWLSHGEWCDVKLMCGGRTFSAHRAVLASVSSFLRHILLSCPVDETPTFIVLPDFDFDAMSSVLYYIYNGEVVVQKAKLETFLDIINAMQIFIDSQYLPKEHDATDYIKPSAAAGKQNNILKRNIFTLGYRDLKDQRYINLKKGKEVQDVLLQYSLGDSDSSDKLVRCQNPSGERESPLGNLKSPFGDRQRNSFLRDLFIETYPRNGNVNGLPAGVLAISNECYRAPASVLFTNANAEHLGADDTLLEPYQNTGEHITHSSTVFHPRKQRCPRDQRDYGETSKGLHPSYLNFCAADLQNNNRKLYENNEIKTRSKNVWLNHNPNKPEQLHQLRIQEHILSGFYVPSIDLSVAPPMLGTMKDFQTYRDFKSTSQFLVSSTNVRDNRELVLSGASRVAILNQVLESPWSPRMPVNYKPFRRKSEHIKTPQFPQITEPKGSSDSSLNDSNNNVSKNSDEVAEAIEINEVNEPAITSLVVTSRRDDFKCTICNQVFTNSESLSGHMRRHNSIARYTCGECGKTFSQLRNFKYHMSIHRGTREFAATCTVCGKYFNDRGYLSSHMKIHRNRKEYKCTLCPKSFNQRVAYNMHVRIHTGVKPHVCEECGKAFSRKMLLKQHQRTHSGERPYACTHCDKRFADRSNMTLHLRLHTGVKPFSCTLCPKSFTKKHHLKSHLNFHTGSKPYSCPRCKLAFTQSSNMRTHLKKCSAPEPSSEGESTQYI